MLQQVMTEPGKIEFHEVPVPEISDREVLIKIMKIGICGSDIHVYHGEHPFTSYPVTQGHEVSGRGGEGWPGSDRVQMPGQKVTIQPQVVCGQCYPCRHGKYNLCEDLKVMGFQTTRRRIPLFCRGCRKGNPASADDRSMMRGAMIEPLAVAVHAVKQARDVKGARICSAGSRTHRDTGGPGSKGVGSCSR
ncbi:MAG: alcohol dehydrogenase catalytic domain-containing protein [Enterocloster sp.]